MSHSEIPTGLLLDIHELVVECNRNLKLDGWQGTVVMTADSGVLRILRPLTKWLEYNADMLQRMPDLDPETSNRLALLRYRAIADDPVDEGRAC